MVTTVAPTTPVEAANNVPTKTTEMAKPPGSVPKSCAIVVNSSSAMRDRSSAIPISTNSGTASSVSTLPPNARAKTPCDQVESVESMAFCHPPASTGTCSTVPLCSSITYSSPFSLSTAIMVKLIRAAPDMAKATGKPERIPANRQTKTMISASSTPVSPNSMFLSRSLPGSYGLFSSTQRLENPCLFSPEKLPWYGRVSDVSRSLLFPAVP